MNNKPIITSLTKNILKTLQEKAVLSYGLLGGDFGKLLFLFHASRYLNNEKMQQLSTDLLTKLLNDIDRNSIEFSYCNGIAGLCKGLELLDQDGFISLSLDAINKMLPLLYLGLDENLKIGNIDYLHGSIGIGRYLLSNGNINEASQTHILKLLKWLIANAIYIKSDECCWLYKSPDNTMSMNNSLSHGLSGTVLFLCQTYDKLDNPSLRSQVQKLLRNIANHMCRNLHDPVSLGSYSDSFADNRTEYRSRLAWCYGDLGYALALAQIAKCLNDTAIFDKAHDIVLFGATHRKDPIINGIKDAGLCHGSAGISLFFDYFATLFNDARLLKASQYWNQITHEFYIEKLGFSMFGAYSVDSKQIQPCETLIDGDSGIGLLLMNQKQTLNNLIIYDS